MTRLLKEPLLHFLVLGAVLFGLYGLVGKTETGEQARIVVSAVQIENLVNGFARVWQRPPTAPELQGLIEDHIRSEIYYREARSLGLDRDDLVVRRRLRQKLEFMAEDMASTEPSDAELEAHLASHPEQFRSEGRFTFRHVFLSAGRRTAPNDDAERVAATLANAGADVERAALGDPFLLGEEFRGLSRSEVARTFGERFAERLAGVQAGRWEGPIASDYGLHFVFMDERAQGLLPPLDAVRQAVRREVMNARRIEALEKFYRALRDRYEITVEDLPVDPVRRDDRAGAMP